MGSLGSFNASEEVPGFMQVTSDEYVVSGVDSRREGEKYPVLVAPGAEKVLGSSSGGISVVEGLMAEEEELAEVSFEDDRDALERETINRVAKMAFASNREEREELIALRKKCRRFNIL